MIDGPRSVYGRETIEGVSIDIEKCRLHSARVRCLRLPGSVVV